MSLSSSLRYGELRTATFSLVVQRNGTASFEAETTTKYGGKFETLFWKIT